ncbi:MAG: tripartite tricarboxylate transporter substrate binding protein [Pseudomonadota bacterium]
MRRQARGIARTALLFRTVRIALSTSLVVGAVGAFAQSAAYPAKPVRIIVPFAPGGPNDLIVRLVGPRLGELWSQPVIIENRPGAGATTGMEVVAKSAPDGYTLGVGNNSSLVIGPLMQPKVGYDPVKDLVPMGSMALTAYVLAVNPRVPAKRVAELIAIARAKPGFLAYASSGAATIGHLATEIMLSATGTKMLHVPYKGAGPSLTALISGETDVLVVALPAAEPFAKAGKLRLIAAAGAQRSAFAPDLPTLIEQGLKVPPVDGRYGLVGPMGVSREVVQRVHATIVAAVKGDDLRKRMLAQGFEPLLDGPEQYGASIRNEIEVFGRIVRSAGIKVDG